VVILGGTSATISSKLEEDAPTLIEEEKEEAEPKAEDHHEAMRGDTCKCCTLLWNPRDALG